MRPLILVDVDGVLNPMFRCHPPYCSCHPGWMKRSVYPNGFKLNVILNPKHGRMLLDLAAETGAELAWGTTWEELANAWIGPLIGLPELPVGTTQGRTLKAQSLVPWCDGRPFVWLDDDETELEAASLLAEQPSLGVQVSDQTGLTSNHLEIARNWLRSLDDAASVSR